jgi:predicted metal-dependent phosphoesterase TrpH
MVPSRIVSEAKTRQLDIIGICDHNSSENTKAVQKAGEKEGLLVIGGMEITSREEAHILAFLDGQAVTGELQKIVSDNLHGENDENAFGEQVTVDSNDRVTGINPKLLIGATDLSIEEIVEIVHRLGGLAIASHVDREMFSVTGQLGFIPDSIGFDALELSPNYLNSGPEQLNKDFGHLGYPLVCSSDAHYPEDIGKSYTLFKMKEAEFEEIHKALCGLDERTVEL